MPIDEVKLKDMIQSASDKLQVNGEERVKLKQFSGHCSEILQVPTVADPNIMENPKDRLLGTKMNDSRRQASYDVLVLEESSLGL